jgi:osmotically inducible lipoprotein OsmB
MRIAVIASFFSALFLLSACGDTVGERAATGGLGGAVVGTALGGPLAGAAIGGTAGAVTADD